MSLHWLAELLVTKELKTAEQRAEDIVWIRWIRTACPAALAGGLAAIGAYYTTRPSGSIALFQITDRFTRAIDQHGSKKIEIRPGAICALERIARGFC